MSGAKSSRGVRFPLRILVAAFALAGLACDPSKDAAQRERQGS